MTALAIWNRSLAMIGAPRISSTTEVSSQKTLVDDHWEGVRKGFVCMHPWDGATTVADLVATTPSSLPDRWDYAFTLPTNPDFAQAWRLNELADGEGPQPHYEIMALPTEGTPVVVLLSDKSTAKLEYSFDPDTDALLDLMNGAAHTALVYKLALTLSRPWGKKEQDIRVLQAEFQEVLYEARLSNGRQQKRKHDRNRPLIDARSARI